YLGERLAALSQLADQQAGKVVEVLYYPREGQRGPASSTTQQVFNIEATEIGGEFLRNHIEDLRATISASDECGKTPRVNYSAPSFLKTGEDVEISWKARDDYRNPGRQEFGEVVQILRIRDTKPPLLLAPPNKVILSDQDQSVELGQAAVFDLASQNINVFNTAPNTFRANERYEVMWQAVDDSGNLATDSQWITIKSDNNPPRAIAQTLSGTSNQEIDIVLRGEDSDDVGGILDPLNFSMEQRPENGLFVAPLLPYFIEDFRIERQLGQTTNDVFEFIREQCRQGIEPARDVVTQPEYITVLDNGDMYVRDDYIVCLTNPGDIDVRNRVALFRDNQLIAEADIGDDSRSLFIAPSGEVTFTNRQRGDDGRLIVLPANLDRSQQYLYRFDHAFPNGIKLQQTASAAFDANNIIYVTDGQVVFIFDGNNVSSNGAPAFLDHFTDSSGEVRFLQQGSSSARPPDITFDSDNNVYVSDPGGDRIWKFAKPSFQRDNQDQIINFTRNELVGWLGKCDFSRGNSGNCDAENHHSFGFSCTNETCGVVESTGENTPHCPTLQIRGECTSGDRPSQFNEPAGIAMSPKDVLYITDYQNSRVQRFSASGEFSGQALSPTPNGSSFVLGDFGRPQDIAVNSNRFYILDREKDLLHVLDTSPFKDITDNSATVTYKSENNFLGSDSFVFGVNDGLAQSEATVRINLTRSFRRPEAASDLEYEVNEDQSVDIELQGTDPDGNLDTLTFRVTEQPKNGTLTGTGANLRYIPAPDFWGEDSLLFVANDGRDDSPPAELKIDVLPVNDTPMVNAESQFDAGLGHLTRFEAEVVDPDGLDNHRMVID
ncbi:MAG: Ig-like domain-containing protein, partial [Pseudomonadota bacterium]